MSARRGCAQRRRREVKTVPAAEPGFSYQKTSISGITARDCAPVARQLVPLSSVLSRNPAAWEAGVRVGANPYRCSDWALYRADRTRTCDIRLETGARRAVTFAVTPGTVSGVPRCSLGPRDGRLTRMVAGFATRFGCLAGLLFWPLHGQDVPRREVHPRLRVAVCGTSRSPTAVNLPKRGVAPVRSVP
jgi:hypothetical protein